MSVRLSFNDIAKKYNLENEFDFRPGIRAYLQSNHVKIVVVDDDPTGIQTVHGCLVLTDWQDEHLQMAFEDSVPFFYILTNSRSMGSNEAAMINREVVGQVLKQNKIYRYKLVFISRSDSTLRGHFPLETDMIRSVLSENLMEPKLPVFFIPCFFEAGRYTIDNVHYLKDGDDLVPVSESEFSHDNVFGYKNADLREYIIEKTLGKVSKDDILPISIDEIRKLSVEEVTLQLELSHSFKYIVCNVWQYSDLYKLSICILRLLQHTDTPLVLRTSSSLPKAMSGIDDKPLLTKNELKISGQQGIFIVGSHVKKTTLQLNELLQKNGTQGIELPVDLILGSPDTLLSDIISRIKAIWLSGKTPVLFTSREELRLEDKTERLNLGKKVSEFLVYIILNLPLPPAFVVAKGGITSHDILTNGLSLKTARVAGQILPGIPVIVTGTEHKYPEMPYIIFPGNVGDNDALARAYEILRD